MTKDRRYIDDLPSLSISKLRAAHIITAETTQFVVRLGDVEQLVGVTLRKFPCGGSYSFFACGCGRRARVLRLFNGAILCCRCCIRRGVRYRCEPMGLPGRAAHRIPKLRAMLESDKPLRLKRSTMTSVMERRERHEAALQRHLAVLRNADLAALKKALVE